jgi:chromosome segregation ATPase
MRRVQSEAGGSNTTILGHMRRWQDTQRAAAAAGPSEGILSEHVRAALVTWVQEREATARQGLEDRLRELDELYATAKEEWERTEAALEEQQQAMQAVRAQAADREQNLSRQVAATQARGDAADRQVGELQTRLIQEQQHAEASRIAAAEARIRVEAAAEGVQMLGRENGELRHEIRIQDKRLAEAEQRAAVAVAHAQNRDEQLAETRQAIQAQAQATDVARAQAADAHRELATAQRELAVCRSEHAALTKANAPVAPGKTQ